QVTTYNYGSTLAASDIARNDLVVSVVYPDSSGDKLSYLYNRQGQVKQLTDQRGVVHAYDFDLLGRLIHDRVISFLASSSSSSSGGQAVDASVQRIERTYEVRGVLASVTNYNSPVVGSGNIVTQVQFAYNSFAQLATETDFYAIVGSSVSTQYGYADGSSNTVRRTSMTYPSARVLNYNYGTAGGMDDALSRVASLIDNDGVTHLADYTRLGLNTFVQLAYAQASTTWSLINGTGTDPYTGFDRFNRVVDNRWFNSGTSADLDRIQHAYDRASDRLWRKNTVAEAASANLDELYAYDGLERLHDLQRGQLNSGNNGIVSGTLDFSQAWGLDATGNWNTIQQYDPNNGNTTDNRTHNQVNEITSSTDRGPVAYDLAGNTTQLETAFLNQVNLTYDAWNRAATNAGQRLTFDGLGRLATYALNYNYYYSDSWQLIEQRYGASTPPERQCVWGLRYIDDLLLRDTTDFTPNRLYALHDPNWNVTAIVDTTATVQERYAYDGYGMPAFMNGSFALVNSGFSSNFGWETLYAGYRYNSGLYLVRHRWHGPFIGRWLTRDPLGLAARTNLYEYEGGGPVEQTDPLGLIPGTDEFRCCRRSSKSGWKILTVRIWLWDNPGANYRNSPDFAKAQDLFEQCCIKLNLDTKDVRHRSPQVTRWVFGRNQRSPMYDPWDKATQRRLSYQLGRRGRTRGVNVHYVPAIHRNVAGVAYSTTSVAIAPFGQTGSPTSSNVLAHEIAHVLGLYHVTSIRAVDRLMIGSLDPYHVVQELTPEQVDVFREWMEKNYDNDWDIFRRDVAARSWRLTPSECRKMRRSPLARDPWRGN
ncbi:MAG TPA: RHS repeat-associated core domain-containing protein, partial [Pirellulales bacterium]|nr:RHS repeat-associated core domain-containing protein [Pirellulales bacterium]